MRGKTWFIEILERTNIYVDRQLGYTRAKFAMSFERFEGATFE